MEIMVKCSHNTFDISNKEPGVEFTIKVIRDSELNYQILSNAIQLCVQESNTTNQIMCSAQINCLMDLALCFHLNLCGYFTVHHMICIVIQNF